MSGAKHTPGPLTIEQDSDGLFTVLSSIEPHKVFTAAFCTEGDATLYAAAPDLLQIAIRSAQTFRMYEALHVAKVTPDGERKARANRLVAEACEAVIAKATGDA